MKNFIVKVGKFFGKLFKGIMEIPFILRILTGLIIGVILAIVLPKWTFVGTLGTLFTSALKAVAPILVFVLITSALS